VKRRVLLLTFIAFTISGCIPKATHEMSSYDLYISNSTNRNSSKSNKILKVKFPIALATLNSSRIFYKKDGITSYYLYSRWSSSLNRLLYRDILLSLQKSNSYKDVIGYSSDARVDIYLETEIIDFYHIVEKESSYAKITINIKYIDAKSNNLIKSRTFDFKKYLDNANAKSFVNGAKEALREFLSNL